MNHHTYGGFAGLGTYTWCSSFFENMLYIVFRSGFFALLQSLCLVVAGVMSVGKRQRLNIQNNSMNNAMAEDHVNSH